MAVAQVRQATAGDAANTSFPQDLGSLAGKILRINRDGTTPRENPFGSPVYSYGHRNPQGLDWHPVTDPLMAPPLRRQWSLLWSSEDPQYGGMGTPRFDGKNWPVPGHAAVVFSAVEEDSGDEPPGNKPKPPANNS